ncbi:hypothetical protein TNCV_3501211 [Trichonephila clavipes]|nr:hypothetical protein TNCV_3501211 [Trichonephila clavipes]
MLAKGERAYSLVDERQRGKRRLRQGEKLNFWCRKSSRNTTSLRGGRTGSLPSILQQIGYEHRSHNLFVGYIVRRKIVLEIVKITPLRRDLELEVNEDDIEELIMGHEDELTIEELQ